MILLWISRHCCHYPKPTLLECMLSFFRHRFDCRTYNIVNSSPKHEMVMRTATCNLQGRIGNIAFQLMHLIAYSLKHGFNYYIPTIAPHQHNGLNPFKIQSTGELFSTGIKYAERTIKQGERIFGCYVEAPVFDNNITFTGYFQSFRYIDAYRKEILDIFNLPIKHYEDVVSIHVRRGDFLKIKAFDVLPFEYYAKCIEHFTQLGYRVFYVYSDDMQYCKAMFSSEAFSDCEFLFVEDGTDLEDLISMASCAHNIVANSSFSFVAAWLNQNPNKIVLCPDETFCWYNDSYIPEYFKIVK